MEQFRKKPVVIEAAQFSGALDLDPTLAAFVADYRGKDGEQVRLTQDGCLRIPTLEGEMIASVGDWIIKGVQGEFYPCKPDIFAATYDRLQGFVEKYPLPFYGPHACGRCGRMVVVYSQEGGGQKFAANYESALSPGLTYPNTAPDLEWHEHVCGG